MSFCSKCNGYIWEHKCPPVYVCWIEDYDGAYNDDMDSSSHHMIYSYNDWSAAEKYAECCDGDGDYTIVSGQDVEVNVRANDGVITKWLVTGESRIGLYMPE